MKRIAILLFEVKNNLGGILPSVSGLYAGLKAIGAEPDVLHLEWKESLSKSAIKRRTSSSEKYSSGLWYRHQGNQIGLTSDSKHSYPYKGSSAYQMKELLSEYDGVIVASSVPSYGAKVSKDDHDWKIVLGHGKPMVYIVRDCHWLRLHPNLMQVRDYFTCLAGVHPAAYYSLRNFPGRITCQVNPFDISLAEREYEKDWDSVCVTSWAKKWKHLEDGIRAVPYLKSTTFHLAGGGIELYYMQATKSEKDYPGQNYEQYAKKIHHYEWHKGDADVKQEWRGKKIWDVAIKHGMKFHGFLVGKELDALQSKCGGLIDFSYHPEWGEHFNRVVVEAMIRHSIPFARPLGISDNKKGKGIIFGPRNVVLIPEDVSPKRTAEIVESSLKDTTLRREIVRRNLAKLEIFDYRKVARHYIRLLEGDFDVMPEITQGETCGKLDEASKKLWEKIPIRSPRSIRRFPRE
jgi:hypothetical protein